VKAMWIRLCDVRILGFDEGGSKKSKFLFGNIRGWQLWKTWIE
jgi:hypothetical protein